MNNSIIRLYYKGPDEDENYFFILEYGKNGKNFVKKITATYGKF